MGAVGAIPSHVFSLIREAEKGGGYIHPGAGGQGEDSGQAEDWQQCVKLLF